MLFNFQTTIITADHSRRPETPPNRIALPKPIFSPSHAATTNDPNVHPHSFKSGQMDLDTFSPVNQNGSFEFDRVLKSGKIHRRVKKKGAFRPSWKPAQLVLRPNLLSIYKNDDATELRASITLSDVTAVTPVRKAHTENVFGIFTPSKNYHFQGQSQQDAADWVSRIRLEARVDANDELFLASPERRLGDRSEHYATYETSDQSEALEDRGSSPEPSYKSIRAQRGRSRANTAQRIPSQIHEHSGNEMMTSNSDFSDAAQGGSMAGSLPHSTLGTSMPQIKPQTPSGIVTASPPSRPNPSRNISQISVNDPAQPSSNAYPPDPSRVIRQGYLFILRSSGVKSWKRVWVVLRPKSLSFYKSEAEYSLVKLLNISSVINAAEIDPVSRNKQFCFQIILDDKAYRFACEDERNLDEWLGSLKSVLARMKREAMGADVPIKVGMAEEGMRNLGLS